MCKRRIGFKLLEQRGTRVLRRFEIGCLDASDARESRPPTLRSTITVRKKIVNSFIAYAESDTRAGEMLIMWSPGALRAKANEAFR